MYPYLLHIGHVSLPTFGVLAACGLMIALFLSQQTARIAGIRPDALWDAGLLAVIAAFVLSRLLLIATNFQSFRAYPILLLAVPSLTPIGLLATAVATLLWLRAKRLPILPSLDAWAPCSTLIWAFLALGHYAEGSDPGLPAKLAFIIFTGFVGMSRPAQSIPLQPVAIYAALLAVALTAALLYAIKRPHRDGTIASLALIAVGVAQFLLSFLRQPGHAAPLGLDPLQYVALGMIATGGTLWLISETRNPAMMEPAPATTKPEP